MATLSCAAWLYGNGLGLRAAPLGWIGLALLAGFAAWSAVSIAWSVAPDHSWIEVNRAIAYALAVVLGVFVGASLPRAPERVATALALLAVPVALYALGGKTLPGLHVDGLLDLDHAGGFNRLKAPLEYWNALALFCVLGVLPMLRLASDPGGSPRGRIAALLGVLLLVLVVALTYSRGGVLALAAGLAAFLALTTERGRAVASFAAAVLAASVPLAVALTREDLTTDLVPLSQRTGDAALVLAAVVVAGVVLVLAGLLMHRLERGHAFTSARARAWRRPALAVLGALLVIAIVGAVAGGAADSFTDTKQAAARTDPNRLLSGNSGNRWTWWKEAAGAWSDKPVGGWGAGSFPVTHRLYRQDLLNVQQPHSVPLQWLAETGIVGALLAGGGLLALLAAALARLRALRWAPSGAPPARGHAAALFAIAVAWLVHAFYDWDWDIPAVTLPALFVLGVLAARPAPARVRAARARGSALSAAVAAFVLVALSAVLPALAQHRTDAALTAIGSPRVGEAALVDAAADAELAARLNPVAVEPLFAASTIAVRRGRRDEARAAIVRALERQPDSLEAWMRLAQFEFERGDRSGLRRAAQRALELDPLNPGTIVLARRAQSGSAPPGESATATGSPLPAP
jgi:O-antigen ligase